MSQAINVLYTGKTHITGGRGGSARSSDGRLDVQLAEPGSRAPGTNPEQLLGAGWSACFLSAIGLAAQAHQVKLPEPAAVDAEIDLTQRPDGYFLQARLHVSIPGVDEATKKALVETAHQNCPYSKALRGNVPVVTTLA